MATENKNPQLNAGHRKRLLTRFLRDGGVNFYDYELLELLLCYSIPRKDVKPVAKELLRRFGNLSGVFSAERHELMSVNNVGENTAGLIALVHKLGEELLFNDIPPRDVLGDPGQVVDFIRLKIGGGRKETFMVIYLDAHNGIIDFECHSGTVDRTTVYNRELAEKALACRAVNVIVAHNHPSGYCEPSAEDVNFTLSLQKSLNTLGIRLHDHIVVSNRSFYSMRMARRLPEDNLS